MTLFVLYDNWFMDHCTCNSYECVSMKLSVTTHYDGDGSPWFTKIARWFTMVHQTRKYSLS